MFLLWPLTLALGVLAHHYTVLLVRSFEAVGETRGMVSAYSNQKAAVDLTVHEGVSTMSVDRSRILDLLAAGKITAEEAERLLDALDARKGAAAASAESAVKGDPKPLIAALPKYLYVKVLAANRDNVNVKIPIVLLRSGLKLTSLIPPLAMDKINETMTEHGMSVDFNNFKPEDIDELIGALRETEVNVDTQNGDTVRVYCA